MPTKVLSSLISSFYADDSSYAASDTLHKSSKLFVANQLQPLLTDLEHFCYKWRVGLNSDKTWCLNFFQNSKNKNTPRLWLKGELLNYRTECQFLGIHFDQKLTFKTHIEKLVSRCKKRLNLLKAIREYGSILFAYGDENLLKKLQAIETQAIKIAYRLPPWATNFWCYKQVTIENILVRIKRQAKQFLNKNSEDDLIKPLIVAAKPSMTGLHSAVYKTLNW